MRVGREIDRGRIVERNRLDRAVGAELIGDDDLSDIDAVVDEYLQIVPPDTRERDIAAVDARAEENDVARRAACVINDIDAVAGGVSI